MASLKESADQVAEFALKNSLWSTSKFDSRNFSESIVLIREDSELALLCVLKCVANQIKIFLSFIIEPLDIGLNRSD